MLHGSPSIAKADIPSRSPRKTPPHHPYNSLTGEWGVKKEEFFLLMPVFLNYLVSRQDFFKAIVMIRRILTDVFPV